MKTFFERWKEGFKEITPLQQANATVAGSLGAAIGLGLGIVVTAYQSQWWLSITLIFFTFLQFVAAIGAKQKYAGLLELENKLKTIQEEEHEKN